MSTKEYANYEARVARFLKENNVKPGCYSNASDPDTGEAIEPFFSWSSCECCNRSLGGTRETYSFAYERMDANARGERVDTFTADICEDCVYYLAYGCLDDLTMLEITKNA